MNQKLKDSRSLSAFIPAKLDELGLTLEAFRVYGHLVRRAGSNKDAYPSYLTIGRICFRGSYPDSPDSTLKAKAIAAVEELIQCGLIWKESSEDRKSNTYHVMDSHDWMRPDALESINIRKGRQGKSRKKRQAVNQDNHPVNGDNPQGLTGITDPVNGDNPQGLTGITDPVNGDNPKDIHLRKSIEGTPFKAIDRVTAKNAAASLDAIAHTPQTIEILAEPVSAAHSPRIATEQTPPVQPELSAETVVPSAPKTSQKRKIKHTPDREPEAFQMFWETYYAFCLDVNCSAGVRAAAVQAWDILLPTIERSELEEGTAYYIQKKREQFLTKGEAIGVSHCCRFLRDLKWQEAIDHKRRGGDQPVMTPANRRAIQTYQAVMTAIKDL